MVDKSLEISDEQWSSVNKENQNMVAQFIEQSMQLSPYTLNQYKSCLKIYFYYIKENCNDKSFYEIKSIDYLKYQNWLSKRGLSSSAIKLKRSVVSSFNGYVELYYLDTYPSFRNYVSKKIPSPPPAFVNIKEPLTIDEYENLCKELENKELWQQLAWLRFSFSTGCRRNESRQLLKSVVDVEPIIKDIEVKDKDGNKQIVQSKSFLTHELRCKGRGTTGKLRRLQFDQIAMDAIKRWIEVRGEDDCPYVFVSKHGDRINQLAIETANIWCETIFEPIVGRRVHPHIFRESRATSLTVEQGKDIKVAQKLLGHNSSETTEIYVIRKDSDASDEAFT
jgi:site-specific recombinase XerD